MGAYADLEIYRLLDEADDDDATCNRCGKSGLEWIHTGARWRLFEDDRPHQCVKVASADDFEDLTQ